MSKKKKATKPAARRSAPKRTAARRSVAAAPSKKTTAATIFVYDTAEGCRVRTSPQLLTAPLGYLEWTVVNLTSKPMPDVQISWPDGGPWGDAPISIKGGNIRMNLNEGKGGHYKYNVTCGGYTEDPEIEFPVN
jgi:hypothetical protein